MALFILFLIWGAAAATLVLMVAVIGFLIPYIIALGLFLLLILAVGTWIQKLKARHSN